MLTCKKLKTTACAAQPRSAYMWSEARRLAFELAELGPSLISTRPRPEVVASVAGIEVGAWTELDGSVLVIAVNLLDTPMPTAGQRTVIHFQCLSLLRHCISLLLNCLSLLFHCHVLVVSLPFLVASSPCTALLLGLSPSFAPLSTDLRVSTLSECPLHSEADPTHTPAEVSPTDPFPS